MKTLPPEQQRILNNIVRNATRDYLAIKEGMPNEEITIDGCLYMEINNRHNYMSAEELSALAAASELVGKSNPILLTIQQNEN